MPQRDHLGKAVLQLLLTTYSSVRVGRIQMKNLLPRLALHDRLLTLSLLSHSL